MKWLELWIDTTPEGIEPVSGLLSEHGVDSLMIDEEGDFKDFLENNKQYWDYVDEDLMKEKHGKCRVTFYLPEDDEGFHLLKVLSIKPPERNENGRIIQDETRSVAHIYVKKLPLFIEDSESVLLPDLKRQVQLRAVDNYIENLRTNGVTRIEYPHGNSLFK